MNKRIVLLVLLTIICEAWAIPLPMESVTNYNVMLLHGAYGTDKGVSENGEYLSSYEDSIFWGDATGLKRSSAVFCQ